MPVEDLEAVPERKLIPAYGGTCPHRATDDSCIAALEGTVI
jgi:hypothetical protein